LPCPSNRAPERASERRAGTALTLVAGALLLLGCEALEPRAQPPAPPIAAPGSGALGELVGYSARLRGLSPEQLEEELSRLRAEVPGGADASGDLRLALLLSTQSAPFRDDVQAAAVLRRYLEARDGARDDLADFALLVLDLLERHLLARVDYARARNAVSRLEEQRSTLEQQIEALKAIERDLRAGRAGATPSATVP
jgi:hypothetical protein